MSESGESSPEYSENVVQEKARLMAECERWMFGGLRSAPETKIGAKKSSEQESRRLRFLK